MVINQLEGAGLYTLIDPPEIKINGQVFTEEKFSFAGDAGLSIIKPDAGSRMFYTEDGSDPRLIGGAISPDALETGSELSLSISASGIIMARCYDNGNWSALKTLYVSRTDEEYARLKVTELYFHPPDFIAGIDTTSGRRYEFIEFKNTGEVALDLSGFLLDSAVRYQFPEKSLLMPGAFYVVVSKPTTFYNNYGLAPTGNYSGYFENQGEQVLLSDSEGTPVINFTYATDYPGRDYFDVQLINPENDGYMEVDVYDITGVLKANASSYYQLRIQTEQYQMRPGIYFIHVKTQSGSQTLRYVLVE